MPSGATDPCATLSTAGHAADAGTRPWWKGMALWPLLLPVACAALTVLAYRMDWTWLLAKANHEVIAPPLLGLTVVLLAAAWWRTRAELLLAVLVVSVAFLCREIHFDGVDRPVYLTLFAVLFWVWRRWPQMRATLATWPARCWLVASYSSYVLSQVVARRVFKGLPDERALHVPVEELVETCAHLLFLYTAWRAFRGPVPPMEQVAPSDD